MQRHEITNWLGTFSHTHSRLGSLLTDEQRRQNEYLHHEGSMSIEALSAFLQEYTRGYEVTLIDTDHPFHSLYAAGFVQRGRFRPEVLSESLEIMNQGVAERADIIKGHPELKEKVKTGVEADILDANGSLDVTNEVLSDLDVVIASLHPTIWRSANNGVDAKKNDYLASMIAAVKNPHVDVLGHPVRMIPNEISRQISLEEWDTLLHAMQEHNVAFEINLSEYIPGDPNNELQRQLIQRAGKLGVPLFIGFDFHNFSSATSGEMSGNARYETEDVDKVLQEVKGKYTFHYLRRLINIVNELQTLGTSPDQVVNSSRSRLDEWLNQRNSI